jgi:hypothetical protein
MSDEVSDFVYTGERNAKGEYHGKGTIISEQQGSKYEGDWKYNKRDGFGVETWTDGDSYSGEWKEDMWHGKGLIIWASKGDKYEGEFKENMLEGYGVYTYASGEKYTGEFKQSKCHGRGFATFGSGDSFDGEYKDGRINGRGVWTCAGNGWSYWGEFRHKDNEEIKLDDQGIFYHKAKEQAIPASVVLKNTPHSEYEGLVSRFKQLKAHLQKNT